MNSNAHLTIDLLRHGEPLGGQKYRGQTDDPLTERGWIQMQAMQSQIDLTTLDQVVSSTLSRCSAFAHWLSNELKIPLKLESDFQEVGFGDWEGLTANEIDTYFPGALKAYYENPYLNTPTNAEPLRAFENRVQKAWNVLLEQAKVQNHQHWMLIGHSGVMRTILMGALGVSREATYHFNLPYATWIRLKVYTSEFKPYVQLMHYQTPEG